MTRDEEMFHRLACCNAVLTLVDIIRLVVALEAAYRKGREDEYRVWADYGYEGERD